MEKSEVIYKPRKDTVDVELMAASLAAEVTSALADSMDQLDVFDNAFKRSMLQLFTKTLQTLQTKEAQKERVTIFYEVVPGFTMVCFRKQDKKLSFLKAQEEAPESQVASKMIDHYFSKTNNQVLVIENEEMLFVLFPVADIEKNLRELGFYCIK